MNISFNVFKSAILVLLLFSTAIAVRAEAPDSPIEFSAMAVEADSVGAMAKLSWMANRTGGTPSMFDIYIAEGETEDMTKFELLDSVSAADQKHGTSYWYLTARLSPGVYTFYVIARNADGSSERSKIKVVTIKKKEAEAPSITIISKSSAGTEAGSGWDFQVKIKVNGSLTDIEYDLDGAPDGVTIDEETGVMTWDNPKEGRYVFYILVSGKDANGETVKTKQKFVLEVGDGEDGETPAKPSIAIVSKRADAAHEGKEWEFDVKIETSVRFVSISYTVKDAPDGLTIDAKTGEMEWDNPVKGRYVFIIEVTGVTDDGTTVTTKQEFVLEVDKGDTDPAKPCVEVSGSVVFDSGEPVPSGVVTAWRIKDTPGTSNQKDRIAKAEIHNGKYVLNLSDGTYKFRAEGYAFKAEWYNNAAELVDGENVTLTCNEPRKSVNFTVTPFEKPDGLIIGGTVIDAETRQPIRGAVITISAVKGRLDKSKPDLWNLRRETNSNGFYEARVPAGTTYIVHAKVVNQNNHTEGYKQQWYHNSDDATTATPITLTTEDRTDINFALTKRESYNNGFSGKLIAFESGESVTGKIVAYLLKPAHPSDSKKQYVASTKTNDDGGFTFTNLVPGTYIVFAKSVMGDWTPGWYVLDAASADSWKHATRIDVGDKVLEHEIVILLKKADRERGKGRIRGHVFDKQGGGIIVNNDNSVQAAMPIFGALIVATDNTGTIIDFSISDENGVFEMNNITIGTILVRADRVWYDQVVDEVELSADQLDTEEYLGMNKVVSSVDVPVHQIGSDINLYPNPSTGSATLLLHTEPGTVTIRITDLMGTVVSSQIIATQGGQVSTEVAADSLPSGSFMIHVTTPSSVFALPLNVVR